MTEHSGLRPTRRRAERLFGAPAQASAPRPPRPRTEAPRAVRLAAAVVGLEAAAVAAIVGWLAYLTLTDRPSSVGGAVAELVFVLLGALALAFCARGLWRVSPWARGPVVALQLLLALLGYTAAFQAAQPAWGIPMLVVVAVELYLLATPEARLAFLRRP